ncbi:hypothetical protein SAMN05444166_4235 [Singulisphaera sp. GP187]|uniref:hypothetical protein n=1 Tax=Singulisphaera sp. GP187 TaxID=1882752 RepID=UPI0009289B98|nr:hypothetical protein [Singulisphaera sp. GP187]SIO38018.1 hypothetical protein SAMN05444166_4235 [Singulisphaera sp. GP187]
MDIVGSGMSVGIAADAYVDRGFGEEVPQGIHLDFSNLAPASFSVGGFFVVECIGPDGERKWIDDLKNGVTDSGIASVLGVYLQAQTQITDWYLLLIDNAGWTGYSASDTMASHAGWSEAGGANYSQSTRPAWTPGAPSGGAVVNASTVDFSMTNSTALTIKGVALCSNNTKGGTTGTLFATASFSGGTKSVSSGDTLKVTYTVGATSSS